MSNDHHHHRDHDSHNEMPFDEKLLKLLHHWIKHNEDHALNYRNWAEKAKANGNEKAGLLLEDAVDMSRAINAKFEAVLESVKEN